MSRVGKTLVLDNAHAKGGDDGEWELNGFGDEDKPVKIIASINETFEQAFLRKPDMTLLSDKELILEAVNMYKSDAGICSKCGDIAFSVNDNDGLCQDCSDGKVCDMCGSGDADELKERA